MRSRRSKSVFCNAKTRRRKGFSWRLGVAILNAKAQRRKEILVLCAFAPWRLCVALWLPGVAILNAKTQSRQGFFRDH